MAQQIALLEGIERPGALFSKDPKTSKIIDVGFDALIAGGLIYGAVKLAPGAESQWVKYGLWVGAIIMGARAWKQFSESRVVES